MNKYDDELFELENQDGDDSTADNVNSDIDADDIQQDIPDNMHNDLNGHDMKTKYLINHQISGREFQR